MTPINAISVLGVIIAASLAGCGTTATQRDADTSTPRAAISPVLRCEALTAFAFPSRTGEAAGPVVAIDSSTATAAANALPAHCIVKGRINPRVGVNNTPFAIGFEMRLPDRWN